VAFRGAGERVASAACFGSAEGEKGEGKGEVRSCMLPHGGESEEEGSGGDSSGAWQRWAAVGDAIGDGTCVEKGGNQRVGRGGGGCWSTMGQTAWAWLKKTNKLFYFCYFFKVSQLELI
jgi:hypothetical protein